MRGERRRELTRCSAKLTMRQAMLGPPCPVLYTSRTSCCLSTDSQCSRHRNEEGRSQEAERPLFIRWCGWRVVHTPFLRSQNLRLTEGGLTGRCLHKVQIVVGLVE